MWNIFVCMIALLSSAMSQQPIDPRNTSTTYQITEKIEDIPDNRTLAPIDPTYGIQTPLNFGNETLLNNNNKIEKTTEHIPIVNPYEITENPIPEITESKPQEKPNPTSQPNNSTDKTNLKKTSFSILHIKGEFDNNDDKISNSNAGFKGFLDGLKSYLYSMKKGLVDGLYNWYHKDEAKKEIDKFYRSFNSDTDDKSTDDDDIRKWIHRDEVKKEIEDFYKTLNQESDDESESDGDETEPNGPNDDDEINFHYKGPKFDDKRPDSGKTTSPDNYKNESDDNETNDDDIDVRFGEEHSQEYEDDDYNHYDDYHYHRKHRKFGDC